MDRETLEVECPVCDHKISVDAVRCPNCDAVFSLHGVDELQEMARELNGQATAGRLSTADIDPSRTKAPAADVPTAPENARPKEKNRLLGKLFKKKN